MFSLFNGSFSNNPNMRQSSPYSSPRASSPRGQGVGRVGGGNVQWSIILVQQFLIIILLTNYMHSAQEASLWSFLDQSFSSTSNTVSTSVAVSTNNMQKSEEEDDANLHGIVNCQRYIHDYVALEDKHNIATMDNGKSHFRQARTKVPFYISVHDTSVDSVRWHIMEKGFYYEKALTEAIETTIMEWKDKHTNVPDDEKPIVLDIGANIGWFALLAASHGMPVHTFEPLPVNVIRICESAQLNGWLHDEDSASSDLVTVHMNGVGEKHGEQLIFYTYNGSHNTGMGSFVPSIRQRPGEDRLERVEHKIDLVNMNTVAEQLGWFEKKKRVLFAKIDVEKFEDEVLAGASRLIESQMIENIVFESKIRKAGEGKKEMKLKNFNHLMNSGYYLYKIGGYLGPKQEFTEKFETAEELYEHFRKSGGAVNHWWKLRTDE